MAPLPLTIYRGISPSFQWPIKFCLYNSAAAFILSIITGNVSQVDRVWTFLPTIYTAYFALLPLWPSKPRLFFWPYVPETIDPAVAQNYSPRALLMFGLVFIWMCRLSYNTWRRGLFNLNDEDYRWAILRQKVPAWLFQVINFVFIAFIQNVILFLLGIPTQIAAVQQPSALSTSDYILATLALVDIATEFVADNQQYSFQTYKRLGVHEKNEWPGARIKWTPADAKRGFVTRGLWAWSRHPNFFCEQSFWAIINLFPLLAPESPRLAPSSLQSVTPIWPLIPSIVLCSLFFSSTRFTESISISKYPEGYRAYQSRVAMFAPFLTPVWGLLLQLQGKKEKVDRLVYGQDVAEEQKKIQ
ncbi:DUF1295-domain-containing protein [Trametes versicolor FP-101664 SS1]|uniref:DUF1295-domain-containing protein n=1 Tax=Trametes versicolor (strain FP-101664) TaxID=717944 RepID=UPI0004621E3C|nr:DUF1295-domain-containing protein [Trametes versicolor FP-101664 SS1]EIW57764.1 DUF1295-domain-containing protein [Trametes versicolor FP-101664 SS1]